MYCSCFNWIMTSIILLSINSGKCCEKSCENVSFCFCTDQNEVPIKKVFEVNEELGDEEQTSKGMPVRGGGGGVVGEGHGYKSN